MQKVWRKSRTFSVHYIDLKPKGQKIIAFLTHTISASPFEDSAYEGIYGNESIYIVENSRCFIYNQEDEKIYTDICMTNDK